MTELKTRPNSQSVDAFIAGVENETKRNDCKVLLTLIGEVINEPPVMLGDSIVWFGKYHFVYESGRALDWMLAGFSPRKQNLTIYFMGGFDNQGELIEKLGKAKTSKGCLYVKKLADIDLEVLKEMIGLSVKTVKNRYADYN